MRARHLPHKMIDGIEHKHCSACDRWLPLIHFSDCARLWDGLLYCCRECCNEEQNRRSHEKIVQRRRQMTPEQCTASKAFEQWVRKSAAQHLKVAL